MAEVRTEIDLFDAWYRSADVDKDGRVGGGEAVPFLQRSGLSKDALFKASDAVPPSSPHPIHTHHPHPHHTSPTRVLSTA